MTILLNMPQSSKHLKSVFANAKGLSITEIHAGFSDRLNWLIDMTDLNAPVINKGRGSWLADITQCSRSATSDWLSNDKAPRNVTLRNIVAFLFNRLPPIFKNIQTIEAWLYFGSDAIAPIKNER